MKKYFAIILYRCYVQSVYTGDVDFSCRYYKKNSIKEVRRAILEDKTSEYRNSNGEKVEWVLGEIIQIDEFETLLSGEEVVGFISHEGELFQNPKENKKIKNNRKT